MSLGLGQNDLWNIVEYILKIYLKMGTSCKKFSAIKVV